MLTTQQIIDKTNELGAHNYHPKDVVIVDAHGVVVTDPEGREYYDMLSAYSAHNFGHLNPEIVAAAKAQLNRTACSWLISRTGSHGTAPAARRSSGFAQDSRNTATAREFLDYLRGDNA